MSGYRESVRTMSGEREAELAEEAAAYNRRLAARSSLCFRLKPEELREYERTLDVSGTGIMGYVTIPEIAVELPIFHGTEEGVLQTAVGHLAGSSLPVGGAGTHCILSGHTGLPSAKLFTDLAKLQEGDRFELHVLGREMIYEVEEILVVEPKDISSLTIEEGEDLCTLITCTPYGINSHRLLVRGRRAEAEKKGGFQILEHTLARFCREDVWAAVAVLAVVHLIRRRRKRKRKVRER